jgi:hypothetical protein
MHEGSAGLASGTTTAQGPAPCREGRDHAGHPLVAVVQWAAEVAVADHHRTLQLRDAVEVVEASAATQGALAQVGIVDACSRATRTKTCYSEWVQGVGTRQQSRLGPGCMAQGCQWGNTGGREGALWAPLGPRWGPPCSALGPRCAALRALSMSLLGRGSLLCGVCGGGGGSRCSVTACAHLLRSLRSGSSA